VEKEIGILWSFTADVVPQIQIFKFGGRLIAEVKSEYANGASLKELYLLENSEYIGDCYIVYSWSSHRMNYATGSVSCVNDDNKLLPPLTVKGVQDQYPSLATKAGLSRTIEYPSAFAV